MNVRESDTGYYVSSRPSVRVDFAEGPGDPALTMLREAQAGAYWAVRAHFTARDDPALVVMPTGAGKTAVMTLLAFGVTRRRLLIIAPTRVIVEQIAREFQTLRVARAVGCLPADLPAPQVHVVEESLGSGEAWAALRAFDVVISTANCAAPRYKSVCDPPEDEGLFDALFLDEAHHWPASTWDSLSRSLRHARIVGFTATPYRNDKKPIPAEIVYNYPLHRAIDRGIYREVEFIPVAGLGDEEARDRSLAERARQVWEEEGGGKLLVRAARVEETEALQSLYAGLGLNLAVVNSDRSLDENEAAIERVRTDERCAGLIAVGMLGEGLDLPVLGIGVLHRPYQSFPITLQFIGRICRMSGQQERAARLLAIPDDVEKHTRSLYESDANWTRLIANLADAAVGEEQERRRFVKQHWDLATYAGRLSVHTLKPSFSVTVYQVVRGDVKLDCDPRLREGTDLAQSFFAKDDRTGKKWRVLITRSISKPTWTTSEALLDFTYDLLIYYLVDDLLFEYTTSPGVAMQVRKSLGKMALERVSEERIEQVISQAEVLAYYNLGMHKVTYASSSVPAYKMMADAHAEDAVRESDSHFFAVGHLFGRVGWNGGELAVGVSGQSAKVWASARNHLRDFTAWCDHIAKVLRNDLSIPLPYVSDLKRPELADALPERPYAVAFREAFFRHLQDGLRLEVEDEDGEIHPIEGKERIELAVVKGSWDPASPHECCLKLVAGDAEILIRYDVQAEPRFSCEPAPPYVGALVKVPERGRLRELTLDDYFAQFPPTVFLVDGSTVVDRYHYGYRPPAYDLPGELLCARDWASLQCDIEVEDIEMVRDKRRKRLESEGKCCVLHATANILPGLFSGDTLIFCDHHAGEIADYVALEPERDHLGQDSLRVHLVHCKASGNKNPGARQGDAYEVLGQARKCVRWLRRSTLFDIIRDRLTEEKLVQGSVEDFERLVKVCSPQTARYTVHVVQPGFDIDKIQEWSDESIRLMFLSLYDELRSDGVDFHVIGS